MARRPNSPHQEVWIVAIAVVIIFLSVLVTLWMKGFFFRAEGIKTGHQNITLTDAVLQCQVAIRAQYKEGLKNLTLDDLSSRFDNKANLYRVFFNAEFAKSARASTTETLHISCQVDAQSGKATEIKISQDNGSGTPSSGKGLFGWP
jgi:hypothetical protein